ncbi:fructosamine kinase [Corynebacterium yudongzhengii]|uniref:Fructosamine kinase n=1 Tax=Corynebacterium yudongzhengii TaxID=2080740 RepID=A0A2U1T8P3_9CORY|nr:fructosamine kinase family protein [Corynebacterium yudongzhengii]AWB82564.1 fructosamine kinase [Corynebacterium yudongzhengii]PWC02380.1 fructosamine kinase [Corynebacterium yudongzhengii]
MAHQSSETLTKRTAGPEDAGAEAAGLRWLREGSDIVVDVIDAGEDYLTIEKIPSARPTADAARTAGRELARIHDTGADAFGAPPPGWGGRNYIGRQEQECTPDSDWARFYINQRVLPFAEKAVRVGHLDASGLAEVEKACEALRDAGITATPARIHGDLWAGNLLFGPEGPALIDPAAHGGHRETDLAMLALFGAPHLEAIREGYEEVHPLPQGWLEHTSLHQLHPLAVHAASHGPSYGHALIDAARDTLRTLT